MFAVSMSTNLWIFMIVLLFRLLSTVLFSFSAVNETGDKSYAFKFIKKKNKKAQKVMGESKI